MRKYHRDSYWFLSHLFGGIIQRADLASDLGFVPVGEAMLHGQQMTLLLGYRALDFVEDHVVQKWSPMAKRVMERAGAGRW